MITSIVQQLKYSIIVLSVGIVSFAAFATSSLTTSKAAPKNIILMIGDGMGPAQIKAYRIYKDSPTTAHVDPLFFDKYLLGILATDPVYKDDNEHAPHSHHDDIFLVTDSASSATAYSTGYKTYNGALAVDPKDKVLPTVLELAKQKNQRVGLISTSQINHATPAAFIAHINSRRKYDEIADFFVDSKVNGKPVIDLFLGGGWNYFKRNERDDESDNRDLISELTDLGFNIIRTASELSSVKLPVAGLFAEIGFSPALDRKKEEPTLADMTETAVNLLNNKDGFFLMVEGSQIDWRSHANDISGTIAEMDDFAGAIQVAIDFAKDQGDTLVLITADHETGGLSIGARYDDYNHYAFNVAPLRGLKHSLLTYAKKALNEKSLDLFLSDSGIELNEDEKEEWDSLKEDDDVEDINKFLIGVVNRATYTGWTTNGHTGVDVFIYGYGPGSEEFRGFNDNTEIGKQIRAWLSKNN